MTSDDKGAPTQETSNAAHSRIQKTPRSESAYTLPILACLYWNPLTFYYIYKETPSINSRLAEAAFIAMPVILLLWVELKAKVLKSHHSNGFSPHFYVALITFGLLGTTDKLLIHANKTSGTDLVFPANSIAHYRTKEFEFDSEINDLGLRDRKLEANGSDTTRVLCFGDSWTFGWGVQLHESWPKKLEQILRQKHEYDIQIINCGRPGQHPGHYLEHMRKCLPVLSPDIVVVGLLQLDDLAQIYESLEIRNLGERGFAARAWATMSTFFKSTFQNTLTRLSRSAPAGVEATSSWASDVESIVDNLGALQKIRYSALREDVLQMFASGNLNPGLLSYYVDFPDRQVLFNQPHYRASIQAKEVLTQILGEMKSLCDSFGAKLVIANLPTNYFTNHDVVRTPSDAVNSYLSSNNGVDLMYESSAKDNNLPYVELTRHFLSLENKTAYFFKYDGHPTALGYEQIAEFLATQVVRGGLFAR